MPVKAVTKAPGTNALLESLVIPTGITVTAQAGSAIDFGSTTLTIPNQTVSYAKIQNISVTQRLIGRNSSGGGVPEEVSVSQLLDWLGSTQGDVIYRDSTGWAVLAPGVAGQVLTSGGAAANPSWSSSGTSDPELAAIAALTSAANTVPYFTGSGTAALATFTATGRSIVGGANAAAVQSTLSLVPGTNVQAFHALLTDIAGLGAPGADRIVFWDESAGHLVFLTPGTNLSISGTTLNASGGAGSANWGGIGGTITDQTDLTSALAGKQALDATLTALAAITTATDKIIYATASDTFATTDFTSTARTLVDDTSTSAMRTTLGLAIGTDIQAFSAELGGLAALAALGIVARTASGTYAARTLTAPAAGLAITNPAGTAGNPTFAFANDLSAVEGLSGTGLARRTGTDTWTVGTTVATAEIADDAVTYAKMQNISATQRALGRNTGGAGDTEEESASQILDWIGTTRGSLLSRGVSVWGAITPGTAGFVLTSNGAGADPTYQAGSALTDGARTDVTVSSSGAVWTVTGASGAFALKGTITPTQITANQNNYSPTGAATASNWLLSTDTFRVLTGISCGQTTGRVLNIINNETTSGRDIYLTDEDSGSTATNRFTINGNLIIPPKASAALLYTGTRWVYLGLSQSYVDSSAAAQASAAVGALSSAIGGGPNAVTSPLDWSQLKNVPAGVLSGLGTKTIEFWHPDEAEPPQSGNYAGLITSNGFDYLEFLDNEEDHMVYDGFVKQGTDLSGGVKVYLEIASTATSGNVRLGVAIERGNTTTAADSFATAVEATVAIGGTANVRTWVSITVPSGNLDGLGASESFRLDVYRKGADALDTINATMRLFKVRMELP